MRSVVEPTLMWMTWRQLFAGRRLWLAAAVSLVPFALAVLITMAARETGAATLQTAAELSREIVIGTLLPLTAAVFGTTAFGGETEDGSVVHLLTKPVARWRMVLSKYVVAAGSTVIVMIPAAVLPWAVLRVPDFTLRLPASVLAAAGFGTVIYCAMFVALGLATRRSLVIALVYVIGIEGVLTRNLTGVKSLSVREYAVRVMDRASGGALPPPEFLVSLATAWTMGTILVIGALAAAVFMLHRYEVAEKL